MIYMIVAAFIALDVITGVIKAFKEKNFNSTVMKTGAYHKAGEVCIVLLGVLVDFAQQYVDLGVSVPVAAAFSVMIVLMEIGSIIENICVINPELLPEQFKAYFQKLSDNKGDEN